MNINYRNYLPYAAAIAVFAIVTLIYFRPLLSGKELRQDDIARHKGMSKEIADYREKHGTEPLWTNSMFGGMPAYQISAKYPGNWLELPDRLFKLFLPHPGGYLFLYCLGFFILLLCIGISPWLAIVGGLAYGFSSYFLIIIEAGHNSKANALGYLPALLGGVILLFRGRYWLGLSLTAIFTAMELNANHVQISYYGYIVIAFVIGGYFLHSLRHRQLPVFAKALGLFLAATVIGLLPNAGNLLTTNEYGKYSTRGKSELSIKSTLKQNSISIDDQKAAEESAIESEPLKQHYERNTTTGLDADYATQWSYGIGETFTFLIPDFKGGASNRIQAADPKSLKKVDPEFREMVAGSNSYFGDQPFTSGPVYIGAIVMFLALLGMFIVSNPLKWPLFFATLLTVMLGWGSNFMPLTDFFMHHVPGYNKFRAVAMIMVVAELTLPLMAMLAVHELVLRKSWNEKIRLGILKREMELKRILFICLGIAGGFCLLCYLMPDAFNDFQSSNEEAQMIRQFVQAGYPESQVKPTVAQLIPQLEIARRHIFRADALRSCIFIALGFLCLYLYFTNKIRRDLFFGSIGLFIVIDLWTVDTRYLNERSFVTKEQNKENLTQMTSADQEILKDTSLDYRVLNLDQSYWNDAATSYYHKSIGGYHGAKLKKIEELRQFHLDKEIEYFYKHANTAMGNDSARKALLGKLRVINMLNGRYFILPAGDEREELPLKNEAANGNAWFVKTVFAVPDADDEILGLGKIDTKTQAITQQKNRELVSFKDTYTGNGEIKLISYEPNDLKYVSNSDSEQFAVFSEIYYPKGWNAYVDGQLKPHIAVNYVLRGMVIPAGHHNIEFKFEPDTYRNGNTIAMIGSILLLITVAGGIYLHRRNNVIVS